MDEPFFLFSDNTFGTRGYTWAPSIIPLSGIFEKKCPKCNHIVKYPKGEFDVVVEGGVKYPDVLGCGAYPFLIVSESVIDDWEKAGITSFEKYAVGIAEVRSDHLLDLPLPQYFRIEIEGRCRIDLEMSGLTVKKFCSECGHLETKPPTSNGFHMVPDSWDGSDIFRDIELYPRVNFCTGEIMKLARINKRTNFRFEPMEGPYNVSRSGIDYMTIYEKSHSRK